MFKFIHRANSCRKLVLVSKRSYKPLFPQLAGLHSPIQDFLKDVVKNSRLEIGPWQTPHPEKVSKGGEDTYFISSSGTSFGVFDGVGGWSDHGINPRDYSYHLAQKCLEYSETQSDPLTILDKAYEDVKEKDVVGTCTACVVSIDENSKMKAINLGDSGFLVIRNGDVYFQSSEQQHVFNMPYQIGYESLDKPNNCDKYEIALQQGDIVVVATDGVLDNLFPNQIADIVKTNLSKPAQSIAAEIASEASIIGSKTKGISPFGENARKIGYSFDGGKEDDITVLVAKILRE